MTILQKIQNFPFDHFYAPQENIFWTMAYWNFLQISVVLLHSLISDKAKDTHTLLNFKNTVLSKLLTKSLKSTYQKKLRQTKLRKELKATRKKIAEMRNAVIAHRFLDNQGHLKAPHVEGVTVSELCNVFEDVKTLFQACSFGSEYFTTLYPPGTVGGKPITKDIDKLLDLIVKDSYWLNNPEIKKQFWPMLRKYKSKEEVEELNFYRRKFGMPEV